MKYNADKSIEEFILNNNRCGVFMDMGTGKTSTLLSIISQMPENYKVLIICPKSVSEFTWQNECKKFENFSSLLSRLNLITGTEEKRTKLLNSNNTIDIIPSSLVTWLGLGTKKKSGKQNVWFKKHTTPVYDFVVVDECSQFKDPTTSRFQSLKVLTKNAKRVCLLSGTPFSNIQKESDCYIHGDELYYLLYLLNIINNNTTFWNFKQTYTYKLYEDDYKNRMTIENYDRFIAEIQKKSVFKKLELDITFNEYSIYTDIDSEHLKTLKQDYIIETDNLTHVTASNKAIMINKALQLSNGFVYDDLGEPIRLNYNKIDMLKMLLNFIDGNAVIFYNFREDLEQILKIQGTVLYEGEEQEQKWNKGEIKYLVLSPFSAKYGLNLQKGGNNIIWFGLIWSSESFTQSNARLYRMGQKSNVNAYYLLSKGSFDTYVLNKLNNKIKSIDDFKTFVKLFR